MTTQAKATKMNEPIKTQVTDNNDAPPVPEDVKQMQDEYRKLVGELIGSDAAHVEQSSSEQGLIEPPCPAPSDTLRAKVEDLPK